MGTVPTCPIDVPMIEVAAYGGGTRVASGGGNPVKSSGDTDAGLARTTNPHAGASGPSNSHTWTASTASTDAWPGANAEISSNAHTTNTDAWSSCTADISTWAVTNALPISTCRNPCSYPRQAATDSEITTDTDVSTSNACRSEVVQSVVGRKTEKAIELALARG